MLGRGFRVTIPQKIFKPMRMPAGLRQALEVQRLTLAVAARPTGVLVADDVVRCRREDPAERNTA